MTLFVKQILSSDLCNHDHEEADTLLILYGIDVAKDDPFQELIVCSPDTDVFLLLISFYKSLCTHTLFRTGKASNNRDIDIGAAYEALGEEKASALIDFHSFTCCDVTSKFFGKSTPLQPGKPLQEFHLMFYMHFLN